MNRKISIILFFAGILSLTGISCTESIPDCPTKMCVMSGGWQLVEVYVDGVKDQGDLSKYRLFLANPNPTSAVTSDFQRVQPSGAQDTGTWSLQNNQSILRLIPNNDPTFAEDWIIDAFTLHQMILVINRASNKVGPQQIKFILEPLN
jgi:hypothetical protein